jgi:hypothetical protein
MRVLLNALTLITLSFPVYAQKPNACTYVTCALRIAPRWSGLSAVRGEGDSVVAHLGFFFVRTLGAGLTSSSREVPGSDSAAFYASRAISTRRVAALAMDGGLMLLTLAGVRALAAGGMDRTGAALASAGAASVAVSVPLQFSADDLLGKSVWWFNRRFSP